MKTTVRWTYILAVLLLIGPMASRLLASVAAPDGGPHATLLLSDAPGQSAGLGLVVVLIAAVAGMGGALLFSRDTAFACAGLVLAWGAWRLGMVENILARSSRAGVLTTISLEAALLGVPACLIAIVLCSFPRVAEPRPRLAALVALLDKRAAAMPVILTAGVVAALASGVVVWLFAIESLKGQTVMAAVLGGIAAGAAGQLVATSLSARLTPVVPVAAVVVVSAIAPLIAASMHAGRVEEIALAGKLFALARPSSLDWAAGAFLGAPIGLSWAASMLERQGETA